MRVKWECWSGLAVAALCLAACHKSAGEEPPVDNAPIMQDAVPQAPPAPAAETPEPAPVVTNAPAPAAPKPVAPPAISADEQMMDDAASTGMTAHVDRNGGDNATTAAPEVTGNQR